MPTCLVALPLLLCSLQAHTQTPAAPGQARPAPAIEPLPVDFDPLALGLTDQPFTIEPLGLSIHLPRGSVITAERVSQQLTLVVADQQEGPTWTIRAQHLVSTLDRPTPLAEIERHLKKVGTGARVTILTNEPVNYRGQPGHLCAIQQHTPEGMAYASGWLVMPAGDKTFLVFSILTTPDIWRRAEALLTNSFATMAITPVEQIAAAREARRAAGEAILAAATAERLQQLSTESQWFRIYQAADPASGVTEEKEIGYSLVEIAAAPRGALKPDVPPDRYTAMEKQVGLLVRVAGRVVIDVAADQYYDSEARYWVSWDQSEETWALAATHRQGMHAVTEVETGMMHRPALTVVREGTRSARPEKYQWDVPEGYMPQALNWVLGHLLPRDGSTLEMSFRFYDASTAAVVLRRDTWAPAGDGSGQYALTTRFSANAPEMTTLFDRGGAIINRSRPDGTVTEPVTRRRLRTLWQSKNLRLGGDR